MTRPHTSRVPRKQQLTAWAHRHRGVLGFAGAAVAAGMTVVWLVVVPEKADHTVGLQELAIRWGHPLCWALLTVAGVLFAMGAPKRARDIVCYAAAACYAAFLAGILF